MQENAETSNFSDNLEYYEIYTLIDITETNETDIYKSETIEYQQYQNLNIIFQIIGLRTQPINPTVEILYNEDLKKHKFSKKYKGTHTVWKLSFYSGTTECWANENDSVYYLKQDAHGVAVSYKLNETVDFGAYMFDCYDNINIYFEKSNKYLQHGEDT